jgi:hypothetical protein
MIGKRLVVVEQQAACRPRSSHLSLDRVALLEVVRFSVIAKNEILEAA